MTVVQLRRRSTGAARTSECDCLVSRYAATGGHRLPSVGFRFTLAMVKRLGWMVGDYVICDFQKTGSTGEWTMSRVAGAKQGGIALSRNNKASTCAAKFTLEEAVIATLFPEGSDFVEATLMQHDRNVAVFAFDWQEN